MARSISGAIDAYCRGRSISGTFIARSSGAVAPRGAGDSVLSHAAQYSGRAVGAPGTRSAIEQRARRGGELLHDSVVSDVAGIVQSLDGGERVTQLVEVDLEGERRRQLVG